jgi:dUTPase
MPRYRVGDKIAQLKIGITFPIKFIEVEEFDETERGMRGYGSSGK